MLRKWRPFLSIFLALVQDFRKVFDRKQYNDSKFIDSLHKKRQKVERNYQRTLNVKQVRHKRMDILYCNLLWH